MFDIQELIRLQEEYVANKKSQEVNKLLDLLSKIKNRKDDQECHY